jgi:hypothetical protein
MDAGIGTSATEPPSTHRFGRKMLSLPKRNGN